MKQALLALGILMLAGCGTWHSFEEGRRENWRCANGREFSLRHVGGAIELFAAGRTYRLEPTGGGRRAEGFAGEGVAFARDGGRASLTGVYGGPYENCRRRGARLW